MRNTYSSNKTISEKTSSPVGGGVKRSFDVVFSTLALVSLLPLLCIIAALVKIYSRGPIFFAHERIGYGGRRFGCVKFRTMVVDAESRLLELLESDQAAREEFDRYRKLKNDPRIIPVIGKFLRASSLDELPQFINVLLGHMSVVGPRPVTNDEFVKYGSDKVKYKLVRPGITGLWQVSGRNQTTFEERVAIDRRYIQSWSMMQDFRIIWKTFEVVSRRDGAY